MSSSLAAPEPCHGIILLVGYAGSGKGCQGAPLAKRLGIPHVSTGELFRVEVASGSEIGRTFDSYMRAGTIIPAELTFSYLASEFAKPDYARGFVLDGYPKNRACFDWLFDNCGSWHPRLEVSRAILLDVPRDEAARRLLLRPTSEAARTDDKPDAIQVRLKSFDEDTQPLLAEYWSKGLLAHVDGTLTIEQVAEQVWQAVQSPSGAKSYYVDTEVVKRNGERSARFHSHLDAENHALVARMSRQIQSAAPNSQIKIYPVSHLLLGPQTTDPRYADVYQALPNFHSISDACDEAFLTGKMGADGYDYDEIRATLSTAFGMPGRGVMTELEQELYESEIDAGGQPTEVYHDVNQHPLDWSRVGVEWRDKQIARVPAFELHHGIDVPRTDAAMPIALDTLMQASVQSGLCVGGWFVFPKADVWSYRCNEFADGDGPNQIETMVTKLQMQARELRAAVLRLVPDGTRIVTTSSLERVDAIWRVA